MCRFSGEKLHLLSDIVFRGSRCILRLADDIMGLMRVRVECYSGRKADERPVRFWLDERDVVSQRARVLRLRRTQQPLAFNAAAVLPSSSRNGVSILFHRLFEAQ